MDMGCRIGYVRYVRLLFPIVGGEVAQSPRTTRTTMRRTRVIPLPHADVYTIDL